VTRIQSRMARPCKFAVYYDQHSLLAGASYPRRTVIMGMMFSVLNHMMDQEMSRTYGSFSEVGVIAFEFPSVN